MTLLSIEEQIAAILDIDQTVAAAICRYVNQVYSSTQRIEGLHKKHSKYYVRSKPMRHKSLMRMPADVRRKIKRERFIHGPYWYKIEALDAEGKVVHP